MAEPQPPPTPPSVLALTAVAFFVLLTGLLDPPLQTSTPIAATMVFVVAYGLTRLSTPG